MHRAILEGCITLPENSGQMVHRKVRFNVLMEREHKNLKEVLRCIGVNEARQTVAGLGKLAWQKIGMERARAGSLALHEPRACGQGIRALLDFPVCHGIRTTFILAATR